MKFVLAPLRGFTEKEFRQALSRHYDGVNECVLPFFSVTNTTLANFKNFVHGFSDDELSHKCGYKVVVQLIGNNPSALARISQMFVDNGFPSINLNLGCPMPQITKKMRGCGLLPHIDIIKSIIDEVGKVNYIDFSLKMRLGLSNPLDIIKLIDLINLKSINNVYIHPRIADDRYEGDLRLSNLDELIPLIEKNITFNGDIVDIPSFLSIKRKYPFLQSFMIGRGLLHNPALVEEIINTHPLEYTEKINKFKEFYVELTLLLKMNLPRIKSFWTYFCCSEDIKKQIQRSNSTQEIDKILVANLFPN